MMKRIIPKGSKLYGDGVFLAKTVKDLKEGYVVGPKDFDPELPHGTTMEVGEFYYDDKLIYQHPNWID